MHTSIDYRIVYNRQDMETTIECPSIDEWKSICYSAIKKKNMKSCHLLNECT